MKMISTVMTRVGPVIAERGGEQGDLLSRLDPPVIL